MTENENEQHVPTAAEIAAAGGIDAGTLLIQALISAFWQPTTLGITHEQQANPYGQGMTMTPRLMQGPSPLEYLAAQVHRQFGPKLTEAVMADVDLDELAEKIAAQVFAELTKEPSNQFGAQGRLTPTAEQVRELVKKRVAEKLSDQVQSEYNQHQQEMFEAWQREQQRSAQRGQLYSGSGER